MNWNTNVHGSSRPDALASVLAARCLLSQLSGLAFATFAHGPSSNEKTSTLTHSMTAGAGACLRRSLR